VGLRKVNTALAAFAAIAVAAAAAAIAVLADVRGIDVSRWSR
jgi:hypothetical protein